MRKINLFVFSVILACFLITCFFYVKAFASVDVGGEVPPNPPENGYDASYVDCVGATVQLPNTDIYYCGYLASSYQFDYFGTFLSPTSNGYRLNTLGFVRVGSNGSYDKTDIKWQILRRDQLTGSLSSSTSWSSPLTWSYYYKEIQSYDGIDYLVIESNSTFSFSGSVNDLIMYNDSIQFLNQDYYDYSDSERFELCKNFDHPQIIGEYDSSIPCLIRSDVSFSNVTLRYNSLNQPLVQAGQINGIVSPFTNKGALTSDYYVDYQVLFGYDVVQTIPYYKIIESRSWTATKYNGGLLLDLFNDDVSSWTSSTFGVGNFSEGAKGLKVSCNAISLNARLRRKSDGNFGDWYCVGVSDLGYNDSSYNINENGYKPLSKGFSGIVSGSIDTPLGDFDESLTAQYNPSTSITANNIALGTSESGGVLQQGGVLDLISATGETNYDNILSYLGEVPKLIGVVFGYLPPFFISFITTAFILLVTVGIVKMLI